MNTAFFVDGYNLYYGLLTGTSCKWLDLPALLTYILHAQSPSSNVSGIHYFTAPVKPSLASRGQKSHDAQATYLRALMARGVQVVNGRHTIEPARAPKYEGKGSKPSRQNLINIWKLEEKQTDVSIAIEMYRIAAKSAAGTLSEPIEQLVLVSADTDQVPTLQAIRDDFPQMTLGVVLPRGGHGKRRPPASLEKVADWMRRRITLEELTQHQFPTTVSTHKKPAIKPTYW